MRQGKKVISILTGSGISQASGIPTFRDGGDALWKNYKASICATSGGWEDDENMFRGFWKDVEDYFTKEFPKPNQAHHLIKNLEDFCKERDEDFHLMTTNIDRLHEDSGVRKVIKIHGDVYKRRRIYQTDENNKVKFDFEMPNVVLFGENKRYTQKCYEIAYYSDLFIVVGSSLLTGELSLLEQAKKRGARLIEINPNPVIQCPFDERYTMSAIDGLIELMRKENYV